MLPFTCHVFRDIEMHMPCLPFVLEWSQGLELCAHMTTLTWDQHAQEPCAHITTLTCTGAVCSHDVIDDVIDMHMTTLTCTCSLVEPSARASSASAHGGAAYRQGPRPPPHSSEFRTDAHRERGSVALNSARRRGRRAAGRHGAQGT